MPLIQYLSRIHFDYGAITQLRSEIERLRLQRPLLVTDPGIASAGLLQRVLDAAKPSRPVVYDRTTENPTEQSLLECLELWRSHDCDGLIALGGGSPIDLTKAVALLTSHGGSLSDYNVKVVDPDRIGKVSPQIAIPTAAGTGAEVGRACVMSLRDGTKSVAVSLNMVADVIICDPEMTLSLPAVLTAATGIDALSHGFEAFCSNQNNPPAAAIALEAARLAAKWLPAAVQEGNNREARYQMMMAALMGGMCLQKSLGAAHAMANPLGELHLHHGTLIGILLPHVAGFNQHHASAEIDMLRKAMGVADTISMENWLARFVKSMGLPTQLNALGILEHQLNAIAVKASKDHLSATNPRNATFDDYLQLLQQAL